MFSCYGKTTPPPPWLSHLYQQGLSESPATLSGGGRGIVSFDKMGTVGESAHWEESTHRKISASRNNDNIYDFISSLFWDYDQKSVILTILSAKNVKIRYYMKYRILSRPFLSVSCGESILWYNLRLEWVVTWPDMGVGGLHLSNLIKYRAGGRETEG